MAGVFQPANAAKSENDGLSEVCEYGEMCILAGYNRHIKNQCKVDRHLPQSITMYIQPTPSTALCQRDVLVVVVGVPEGERGTAGPVAHDRDPLRVRLCVGSL